ncbi:MAG: hypothetical protein IKH57_09220 [Clostridia bacterium]|nr:hypothetical protein [Clostridia bacterium]
MAEEIKNGKKTGIWGGIFIALGALLLMAVIYVSAILLQMPEEESYNADEQTPVTRMQPAAMSDARALAELFGAQLPYLPGYAMAGSGTNADYEGVVARVVTLQYSGVTVAAVRPASAAPLLLHGDLSVEMRSDLSVLNLPAMLASKGQARCVYLTGKDAAYSVYAPQAAEEDFISMLEKLKWTE